jgi:hypothetical protein
VAREVVDAYLGLVDAEAPGLVEAFYLVGSVALGEFRPHESDIDFVAVTATRPDAAALPALRRVHTRTRASYPRPHLDGVYVGREDLGRDPGSVVPVPAAQEGEVGLGDFEPNPVTWHTLAHPGVAVRGPEPGDIDIWTDLDALAAWTLGNLESYWRPWRRRCSRPFSIEGVAALGSWAPAWGVLGVSRLHYTLATGGMASKEGAGIYALRTFPERWRKIVEECLRIRRGGEGRSLYRTPPGRRRDALAFIAMATDDARRFRQVGAPALDA